MVRVVLLLLMLLLLLLLITRKNRGSDFGWPKLGQHGATDKRGNACDPRRPALDARDEDRHPAQDAVAGG
jgi:hypothetical protein